MIGLIQRVTSASVKVDEAVVGEIAQGLLVLVGIEKTDIWQNAEKLAQKILNYRVFSDKDDRMNLNVTQVGGEILLVSQFTLTANTSKGNRPGFDPAMPPVVAKDFFHRFCVYMAERYPNKIQVGQFGANMQVSLVNDGPVTFWLQC
ncbi:D-aminoacyl-tRNA deacylase [Suttonella ornithocola]|uniref:D-aminoacyl-tRNA deacylase n=1 Tax=Suttonella ornithocola TaxID=279832 RepID=A0A380MXH1_9GAMM|nr:D-aminoacyl-tRNA deacylase [Suttonella ornithocola]SUO97275.1 D-tyrosyl-tRNA(Tyr) deacylase [Suttonella ornithocola]